jgi:hypothetical protein
LSNEGIFEFEIPTPTNNTNELISIVENDPKTRRMETPTGEYLVPSLDMLFALKASHRYAKNSPFWWKTLADYHLMKVLGAKIPEEVMPWFRQREKETYKFRTPKLKGTKKDEFFDPNTGINYIYDHDSIHEAVKLGDKPAYRHFIKDGEQVACSKEKFFAASNEVRLHSVLEESYVLALERSQIPFPGKLSPKASFKISFSKVLSSITSGWWREWGYDNALAVLSLYSDDYMDKFKAGVENGTVKPFTQDANPYK